MPPWGVQTPPVGIASLASYLRSKEVDVSVLDFNISLYNKHKDKKSLWNPGNKVFWVMPDHFNNILDAFSRDIDVLVKDIIAASYDIVSFSVFSDNRLFTVEVIKRLREKGYNGKIIAGGVGCFSKKEQDSFPKESVDAFVIGEGEMPFLDLIKYYSKDTTDSPKDVISRDFPFKESKKKPELDTFGFPDFEEFDLKAYTNKSLAVTFSRGCVMNCLYCNDRKIMGAYRQKTAKAMFDQIKYYVDKHKVKEFAINDLQLNADTNRLKDFCDMVIGSKLNIVWTANMMPSEKMDLALVKKLKKAGCSSVIFGVESASENVLKKMNRKFTTATAVGILKHFHKVGIEAWVNIIVGYPGETRADFEKTLKFLKDNRNYISKVSVLNKCNIVHNSNLYEQAKRFGILFPEDKSYEEVRWTSLDGNTETLRDLRLQRAIIELDRLNLQVLQTNVKYSDPIAEDDELKEIFGDIAFVRDSRNILVSETDSDSKIVNAYLLAINEILDYKELQIREIIEHKHQEIETIADENRLAKEKIAKDADMKIKELVDAFETKISDTVESKDEEIKKLTADYVKREAEIVSLSDKKIADLAKDKDAEFENKFELFKADMENNLKNKEALLVEAEQRRSKEVSAVVSQKDSEIADITSLHTSFVEDLVAKKDKEINDINDKYQHLISEKENFIVDLTKARDDYVRELETIKNSKLFRLRRFVKRYLRI